MSLSKNEECQELRVKYFDDICKLTKIKKGNWIDVRSRITTYIKKGEAFKIPLGFAMQLPEGYEAHVAPRSSTFNNYGLLQTNSVGVIDNSYCGDNDEWSIQFYATSDTVINRGDRIGQFRIIEVMPEVKIIEVETLGNPDRGGYGSTGVK